MTIVQALQQEGVIASMARELNIDEATAQQGAGALLPALVAGLGRSHVGAGAGAQPGAAGGASGLGGLADMLGGLAGGGAGGAPGGLGGIGGVLLNQVLGPQPTPVQPGNDILGQIFGTKDVSRGVAEAAAGSSGVSSDLLKKMLPILAMAVVGYMMKKGAGSGTGPAAAAPGTGAAAGGGLGGILGQVVGGMMRR